MSSTPNTSKRAHSPASLKGGDDETETPALKRAKKKDVISATSTPSDENKDKEDTVDIAETTGAKRDEPEDPTPTAPSFHGNFDLYAMKLPFLNAAFAPDHDYAALLELIRTYQAKPDNSAQIFLPADLRESPDGPFRSRAIQDPLECMPFEIALKTLALQDSLKFTAHDDTDESDALYSDPDPESDTPGITGSVALEESHCGVSSIRGTFKMRRAWVSDAEGGRDDEVFEGFFSVHIVYSGLYRRKCFEDWFRVRMPFWAIRARVDKDGKEVGLGPEWSTQSSVL